MTTNTLAKSNPGRRGWTPKLEDVQRVEKHVAGGTWGDLKDLKDTLGVNLVKRSDLRRVGLNDKALTLLGEPDAMSPNPHHPAGAPMWSYTVERVRNFMASEAYRQWLEGLR